MLAEESAKGGLDCEAGEEEEGIVLFHLSAAGFSAFSTNGGDSVPFLGQRQYTSLWVLLELCTDLSLSFTSTDLNSNSNQSAQEHELLYGRE